MSTVVDLNTSANTNSKYIENDTMIETRGFVHHDTQSFDFPGFIPHSEEMRVLYI